MKKLFALLLLGAAFGFASCSDDTTDSIDFRLTQPATASVSDTAATVSTEASYAAALGSLGVTFTYGPYAADEADYLSATDVTVDGKTVTCRLTGLEPETRYRVYAWFDTGVMYVKSPAGEFTTKAVGGGDPEPDPEPGEETGATIIVDFGRGVSMATPALPAGSGNGQLSGTYVIDGYTYRMSASASFKYYWFENTFSPYTEPPHPTSLFIGKAGAYIELPALEEFALTGVVVDQALGGGAGVLVSICDSGNEEVEGGDAIQLNSGETAAWGLTNTVENTSYRIYIGNAKNLHVAKMILTYGDGGDYVPPTPADEEPAFGTTAYSGVTSNSATVSSSYTYTGDKTVDEVYFIYHTTGGPDVKVDMPAAAGSKTTQLTKLTASTTYSFYLCVKIGGQVYKSGASTFVTEKESSGGDGGDGLIITLTIDSKTWPKAYPAASTITLDDNKYAVLNVADYGNGIQFKKTSGYLGNAQDNGAISKIEMIYESGGSASSMYLYVGTAQLPTAIRITPTLDGSTYVFDCSAAEYHYFKLMNGSGASYVKSLTIYHGEGGEVTPPDPDIVKPTFGTTSSSSVTKDAAAISSSYAYSGTGVVEEVYFAYRASGGSEQKYALSTTAGNKNATLTSLSSATNYSFWLCVKIDGVVYQSESSTFTTKNPDGTPPTSDTYNINWPELPTEVVNSNYYYAHHICPDFKVGGHLARNYTVCYSAEHHCPLWSAAPRHKCYESGASRTNAYAQDPQIPASIQYSSKSTGGGCNKGHMLGSAERLATTATNKQVFYYTNIAPQFSSTFNTGGGAWNNLEDWVDGQVCADTTYVVIGTYFQPFTDAYGKTCTSSKIAFGSRTDVSCPSMFYYLILRTKSGSTGKSVMNCSASELKCSAFVLRHNMDKGHKPAAADMMSVEAIENLTGFKFFTNVPNAPKGTPVASEWGL